jgi:hypothetical protein
MRIINLQFIFYLLSMLQLKHHKAMWYNGRKFCIKMLDDKMKTSDCGIMQCLRSPTFPLEVIEIQKKLRIGTMAIWRI